MDEPARHESRRSRRPAASPADTRAAAASAFSPPPSPRRGSFRYGITGAWAVARGARASSAGSPDPRRRLLPLGHPGGVPVVGALLLAGFAVLLAAAMLVLYDARGRGPWAAVGAAAAVLTAGSLWAAASGGLHPGLWLLFFGGLVYAVALSAVRLLRATRGIRR